MYKVSLALVALLGLSNVQSVTVKENVFDDDSEVMLSGADDDIKPYIPNEPQPIEYENKEAVMLNGADDDIKPYIPNEPQPIEYENKEALMLDEEANLMTEEEEEDDSHWQEQTDVETLVKDVEDTLNIQIDSERVEDWDLSGLTKVATKFDAQVFMYQNLMRTQPKDFIPYVDAGMKKFVGKKYKMLNGVWMMTNEGPAAYQEFIDFLKEQKPIPPLKWDEKLAMASRDHAKDCAPTGLLGHYGTKGSTVSSRIKKYQNWKRTIGENIMYGSSKPMEVLTMLAIDDGVPSRGHRTNIFKTSFVYQGCYSMWHAKYRTQTVLNYMGDWHGSLMSYRPAKIPTTPEDYKGYATIPKK